MCDAYEILVSIKSLGLVSSMKIFYFDFRSENEIKRLTQGGISKELINSAVASFILQTIVNHGEPADRLCNKVGRIIHFNNKQSFMKLF